MKNVPTPLWYVALGSLLASLLPWAGACARVGGRSASDGGSGGATEDPAGDAGDARETRDAPPPLSDAPRDLLFVDGPAVNCKNLQCQQMDCGAGIPTTLTGTVYAPNGTLPLFNALVFVPNAPVPDLPRGLTCDRCDSLPPGEPVVAALTDAHGVFTLKNVPVGTNIPLVIQVGKWRRQITVPSIVACQENHIDDPNQTRLPRNRTEGDMPRMAITTGGCDNLLCLLPHVGIDPAEWGISGEDKAVTFFAGSPNDDEPSTLAPFDAHLAQMSPASALWGNPKELETYDVAIFSCECDEVVRNKGPTAYAAVTDYLAKGGRVFGTDFQYVWYKNSPDAMLRGLVQLTGVPQESANPVVLDTTFPKGKALADWLQFVSPPQGGGYGTIECSQVFDNFSSVTQPASQVWGTSPETDDASRTGPRFITVNTPVGMPPAQQCGRAVHLDAHVVASTFTTLTYPDDCGPGLADGEQALAFFLFDVAACVQEDLKPIVVPIIP